MKHILTLAFLLAAIFGYSQFKLIELDDSHFGNYITQLDQDEYGIYFVSRGEKTLTIQDKSTNNMIVYDKESYDFTESSGAPDDFEVTSNMGAFIVWRGAVDNISPNGVTDVTSSMGFRHKYISSITEVEEALLVSYFNGFGLSLLIEGNWLHKGSFEDFLEPLNSVSNAGFVEYQDDVLWIYNDNTMYEVRIEEEKTIIHKLDDSGIPYLGSNPIKAMTITADGTRWFATTKGLLSYDNTTWKLLDVEKNELPFSKIDIIQSIGNKIIIGGKEGIAIGRENQWRLYTENNSNYPQQPFLYDSELHDNKVYVGSSRGLIVMDLNETSSSSTVSYQFPLSLHVSGDRLDIYTETESVTTELYSIDGKFHGIYSTKSIDIGFLSQGSYVAKISDASHIKTSQSLRFIKHK